mgnify:CR=1 FL=1
MYKSRNVTKMFKQYYVNIIATGQDKIILWNLLYGISFKFLKKENILKSINSYGST